MLSEIIFRAFPYIYSILLDWWQYFSNGTFHLRDESRGKNAISYLHAIRTNKMREDQKRYLLTPLLQDETHDDQDPAAPMSPPPNSVHFSPSQPWWAAESNFAFLQSVGGTSIWFLAEKWGDLWMPFLQCGRWWFVRTMMLSDLLKLARCNVV